MYLSASIPPKSHFGGIGYFRVSHRADNASQAPRPRHLARERGHPRPVPLSGFCAGLLDRLAPLRGDAPSGGDARCPVESDACQEMKKMKKQTNLLRLRYDIPERSERGGGRGRGGSVNFSRLVAVMTGIDAPTASLRPTDPLTLINVSWTDPKTSSSSPCAPFPSRTMTCPYVLTLERLACPST